MLLFCAPFLLLGSDDVFAAFILFIPALILATVGPLLLCWCPVGWLISNHVRSHGGSGRRAANLAAVWTAVANVTLGAVVVVVAELLMGSQGASVGDALPLVAAPFASAALPVGAVLVAVAAQPRWARRGWEASRFGPSAPHPPYGPQQGPGGPWLQPNDQGTP